MYKKVFYNTATQTLGKVMTAASTLLVTVLIGNNLGEALYGEFTKIFVFVGYFYTLVDFGLNSVYVKIAKDDTQISLLKSLLGLRLVMGLALALIASVISLVLPYDLQTQTGFSPQVKFGIMIASITILTQALIVTANSYFQKPLRYDLATLAAVFGSATFLVGTYVVSSTAPGLFSYTSIYVLSGLSTALLAYFLIYKKSKTPIWPQYFKKDIYKLFSQSWPIGIALVLNIIYFRIDIFILSSFRSSAEVGVYGLAYQFFEASLAIPIFFSNALYPVLIKIYQEEKQNFRKNVSHWLKILSTISFILTFTLFIFAGVIPYIYNGQFTESVLILRILVLGIPFFFLTAVLWHALIIFGKQKTLINIYLLGAVVNLLLNLAFIPSYGFLAAAVTTVVSEAFILALLTAVYLKSYNQQTYLKENSLKDQKN